MKRTRTFFLLLAFASSLAAAEPPSTGLQFNDKEELLRPADYREWVFLTSGLGMSYGPNGPQPGQAAPFDNVFVRPDAYRSFMKTGIWPNGTMFILEIRSGDENVSINRGGRTQGNLRAVEAAVKDTKRYPDGGWAYFSFDGDKGLKDSAAPIARTASCYACHSKNGAVEWTFTQFYPTAFEVAQQMKTVRPDYDPSRKAE